MAATREKRANAGSKMAQLLNEEEEDEFYKTTYGGFEDEEDDKGFSSDEAESSDSDDSDTADSDFSQNESDEPISEEEDEGETKKKRVKFFGKKPEPKKSEPKKVLSDKAASKTKQAETKVTEPQPSTSREHGPKKPIDSTTTPKTERKLCVRKSTALKSAETRQRRRDFEEMRERRKLAEAKKSTPEYRPLTQAELLAEAKKTEIINLKSLESYERMELEKKKKLKTVKQVNDGRPMIRYHSVVMPHVQEIRRGNSPDVPFESVKFGRCSRNFVTFTDEKTLHEIFPNRKPKPTQRSVGPVSQLPARYFDPVTQLPYYNVQEFKILRQAYYHQLEKRGSMNDPEIAAWLEWRKQNK